MSTKQSAIEAAAEAMLVTREGETLIGASIFPESSALKLAKAAILTYLSVIAKEHASDADVYRMARAGHFCDSGGPGNEVTQIMRAIYCEVLSTLLSRAKEQQG
jgi:hypothetical protein